MKYTPIYIYSFEPDKMETSSSAEWVWKHPHVASFFRIFGFHAILNNTGDTPIYFWDYSYV